MSGPSEDVTHPLHVSSRPHQATSFDAALRETLEAILGSPTTEWSWLKASLPSSRGGVNLRLAALHAPAAFVASTSACNLVGQLFNEPPSHSPTLGPAIAALSTSALRPDWEGPDEIDVPTTQRHLSLAIDEEVHHQLLSSAPSTRARALALSTSLPHTGTNVIMYTPPMLHGMSPLRQLTLYSY